MGIFNFFKKRSKTSANNNVISQKAFMNSETQKLQDMLISILAKSVAKKLGPGVSFETSNDEDAFFREVIKETVDAKLNPRLLYFEPMSNKSFSVQYGSYAIGKIKLSGRKTYMQVLSGLYGVDDLSDLSLEDYISHIPKWIKQMKYCIKN